MSTGWVKFGAFALRAFRGNADCMSQLGSAVERLDHAVGDKLEGMVRNHHRRRLEKLGRPQAPEPDGGSGLWAEAEPPPRPGNDFQVLIDGERALPAIAHALAAAR